MGMIREPDEGRTTVTPTVARTDRMRGFGGLLGGAWQALVSAWLPLAARLRALRRCGDRERARQLEVISEVGRIVNSAHEMPAILSAVARELRRVVPYSRLNFGFYDPDTNMIVQHHILAGDQDHIQEPRRFPADQTASWQAMRERRTLVSNDIRQSPLPRHREVANEGILSAVSVPLLRDERCLGVLNVDSEQAGAFTPDHVAFLEALAAHLSVAVDNAMLFDALHRELAERRQAEGA